VLNDTREFVRDCWYVAGWDYEFGTSKPEQRELLGEAIVLFRKQDGTLAALEDRCVHRHAPLSLGKIEGDHIRCWYHGLRFTSDGKCVEIPGQDTIPPGACVRAYPVVERGGWAWVWMGEAVDANPDLIPPAIGFDNPNWVLKSGQLDYDAPQAYINDNLLDLSHLAYVHANSFGATTGWISRQPKTSVIDRGVRVERWVRDTPPLPPLPSLAKYNSIDMWASYDFLIPGVFLMYTSLHPPGTAEASDHGAPTGKPLFNNFTCQAVTPITHDRSRYFFSWGPGSEFGGEEIAQQMLDVAAMAFGEDKVMIEAQMKIIARDPARQIMPIAADKTVILFQRMMDKMRRPARLSPRAAA
jgi:vanillate O-demethylase monooxygenase subunit